MKKNMPKLTAMLLVTLSLVLGAFTPANDNTTYNKTNLPGIWELLVNNQPVGFLKIIGNDGSLSNVAFTPHGCMTMLSGSISITSDSTYVEKITESVDATLVNSSNNMRYKMDNKNMVTVKFTLRGKEYIETYRRVPFAGLTVPRS